MEAGGGPHRQAAAAPGQRQQRKRDDESESRALNVLVAKLLVETYAPYVVVPVVLAAAAALAVYSIGISGLVSSWRSQSAEVRVAVVALLPTAALLVGHRLVAAARRKPVYLVDFATFRPDDSYKLDTQGCARVTRMRQKCTPRNMLFQLKLLLKSGIGDDVYGPPYVRRYTAAAAAAGDGDEAVSPPGHGDALDEMDLVLFGALDELLRKTRADAAAVDYVFVAVSTFAPAPSLASRLVRRFGLRPDVRAFNLSGMGCSAGMIALQAAAGILRSRPGKRALVLGTENITSNLYLGNERSMLVTNCLFRCGSFALLLSSRPRDASRSKLRLLRAVRTTLAADDAAYKCIYVREDERGNAGASLGVELLDVAARAVTVGAMQLVPEFMPLAELARAGANAFRRRVLKHEASLAPYSPRFKAAFQHFGVHPGGRAVLDGIGKSLRLSDYDMEPSRMSLHRFGNTSSSGIWYALSYKEAKRRLKKGDRIWQIALGSGFKCGMAVWKVLRDIEPTPGFNPWLDFIDDYPVHVPDTIDPSHKHYAFLEAMEEELRRIEETERGEQPEEGVM